jgi:ABC-type polysaccharide/polyol phosphate export permease
MSAVSGELALRTLTLLPLGLFAMVLLTASIGIFGSALYVQYRDVKFMFESGLLILFYASPVFYTSERLGSVAHWQRLNPVTGVLSLMRGALVGYTVDWVAVGCTFGFATVLFAIALVVFERRSQVFADLT